MNCLLRSLSKLTKLRIDAPGHRATVTFSALQIATTNIQENGKRISIHNLDKNHSEQARKEIEEKYGLVKAGSKQEQGFDRTLSKAGLW